MQNPLRTLMKAHVKAYYRNLGGKIVYVPEHDDARPDGKAADLPERTAMGRHSDGSYYLRATDAEDAKAIQGCANKLGIEVDKRRRGATHHGRLGAYDHFHVQDPSHAGRILAELGAQDGGGIKPSYDPSGPAPHEPGMTSADSEDRRRMVVAKRQEGRETIHKGDRACYTGTTRDLHGGKFHEIEYLEGHRKGQKEWTLRGPEHASVAEAHREANAAGSGPRKDPAAAIAAAKDKPQAPRNPGKAGKEPLPSFQEPPPEKDHARLSEAASRTAFRFGNSTKSEDYDKAAAAHDPSVRAHVQTLDAENRKVFGDVNARLSTKPCDMRDIKTVMLSGSQVEAARRIAQAGHVYDASSLAVAFGLPKAWADGGKPQFLIAKVAGVPYLVNTEGYEYPRYAGKLDPDQAQAILGGNSETQKRPTSERSPSKPHHTVESIAKLQDHNDDAGFGYFGHRNHHPEIDRAVAEAANHHGLDRHQVTAFLHGRSGRWAMDELDALVPKERAREANRLQDKDEDAGEKAWQEAYRAIPHEKRVEHFKKWMDPKGSNWKHFRVDDYASELREREGGREVKKALSCLDGRIAQVRLHHATVALNVARLEPRYITKALGDLAEATPFQNACLDAYAIGCNFQDIRQCIHIACGGNGALQAMVESLLPTEDQCREFRKAHGVGEAFHAGKA